MDWKKIGKKALDVSKHTTEKSLDSFQDWKNDPNRIEKNRQKKILKNYTPIESKHFIFNELTGEWSFKKNKKSVYSSDALLSFEYLESDASVVKGGASIGRAAVGGFLLGGAGLVLGGTTGKKKTKDRVNGMKLVVTFKDNHKVKSVTINYSTGAIDRSGFAYQGYIEDVQSDLGILNLISEK